MKGNSRNKSKLLTAFSAGRRKEFTTALSALGVVAAARTLVPYLMARTTDVKSLRCTSQHLFDSKTLRGIQYGSMFIGMILFELEELCEIEEVIVSDEERKGEIIQLLSPHLRARHLVGLEPQQLGHCASREIARTVHNLPDPQMWMLAAVSFKDPEILRLFPLTSENRLSVWRSLPPVRAIEHVQFLLDHGIYPETHEEKQFIIGNLIEQWDDDQDVIVGLICDAWPSEVATFTIQAEPLYRYGYWSGKALITLLASGATLHREDWINVFRWDRPKYFRDQIEALSMGSPCWVDWNIPNAAGCSFLEEVFFKLISYRPKVADPNLRVLLLETLLNAGARPCPLMTPAWHAKLSQPEKKLLLAAAAARSKRIIALEQPAQSDGVQVALDLV